MSCSSPHLVNLPQSIEIKKRALQQQYKIQSGLALQIQLVGS